MKAKLGVKVVSAMQPATTVWDTEISGFCARRQFSDIITYSVVFRTKDGIQHWYKVGRHPILTPDMARREAIRVLRDVALGRDPSADRHELRHGKTVAQLIDEYVSDMTSGKHNGKKYTTIKSDLSRIKHHIRPDLGRYKVAAITSEQIETFMNAMSRGSAKRIIALTSAIFSFAVKRKLRPDNPCSTIEKPSDIRRNRRLSNDEYVALHKGLPNLSKRASDIILFLALSGWRSSEANQLKWAEVDIDRRIATLTDTKSGQSTRPLSEAVIEIIRRQSRETEFVFTKPVANLPHQFSRLGLPRDVSAHCLRHSFASLAGDLGLADSTIGSLLGHRQGSITSRYIHLDKSLIAAADTVAQETLRLMRG